MKYLVWLAFFLAWIGPALGLVLERWLFPHLPIARKRFATVQLWTVLGAVICALLIALWGN